MVKLYTVEKGAIRFSSERRPGHVQIPNYVFDLWLPLLGAMSIGVYATYCRLERDENVKRITIGELAQACRIGKKTLLETNKLLVKCGFIRLKKPVGKERLMHYTTEIVVLDPPMEVSAELIEKEQHPAGYKPLSHWLVEPPAVLDRTSGGSDQNHDVVLSRTANIEDLNLKTSKILNQDSGADAPPPIQPTGENGQTDTNPNLLPEPEPTPTPIKEELKSPPPSSAKVPPLPTWSTEVKDALAKLCRMDWTIRSNATALGGALSQLNGKVTIDLLRRFYANWYKCDFRGKQGQAPKPHQVVESWIEFTTSDDCKDAPDTTFKTTNGRPPLPMLVR